MSEAALKDKIRELEKKIGELEIKLEKTSNEIDQLEDTIEEREDKIMELEAIKELEEGAKSKSKKIRAAESRFAYELEEKDKYIRDLKNSMGILRKDYTQLQQEFEKFKNIYKETSVIRVEDLRKKPPLNALVADLQDKVNKQKSIIKKLEYQLKDAAEFEEKLNEKDNTIEIYKSEINELNQKINELNQKINELGSVSQNGSNDSITKKLIEDLQKQLNKSKRQIFDLKQKLSKFNKKSKKPDKKNDQIEKLKNEIKSLKKGKITTDSDQADMASSEMILTLKDDLQNKLNKSKLEVKSLQEQIKKSKTEALSETGESQKEIESKLKLQREMAIFLQKQLEAKDGEVETIKNEAVQIKKRYRQLENQLKTRDQKFNDLQKQIESHTMRAPAQTQENPHLTLRLRELKGIIDDLQIQNTEQRMELAQLRKK